MASPSWRAVARASLRALSVPRAADAVFAVVVGGVSLFAAALYWIPACLALQDYTQFLVFARVVRDLGDPSSPFQGNYALRPWYTPTSLPTQLTAALAGVMPGGVESAGRLMLSLHTVGLVAASLLLLRELGRPRWGVVLVLPLLCNQWVYGGFFAYATAIPLVVLGLALALRWCRAPTRANGVALAACLVATLLWHGIAYVALGLGFACIWLVTRFPRWRDRLVSLVPALPSLVLFVVWQGSTFGRAAAGKEVVYLPFWKMVTLFGEAFVMAPAERASAFVWMLLGLVVLAHVLGDDAARAGAAASPAGAGVEARSFRVHNPMLLVAGAYVAAYFALPITMYDVQGLSNRFAFLAVLCLVFVWRLPGRRAPRAATIAAAVALGLVVTVDMKDRLKALGDRTRGASELVDRLDRYDTLYYFAPDQGTTPELTHATIELEQLATIRKGGLPRSSFAGYGYTYVRWVVPGHDPMPPILGAPTASPDMMRFDYALTGPGEAAPSLSAFRLVATSHGWSLYGVCGSHRFPQCG